jgi:hypothetical protein
MSAADWDGAIGEYREPSRCPQEKGSRSEHFPATTKPEAADDVPVARRIAAVDRKLRPTVLLSQCSAIAREMASITFSG